GLGGRCPGRHAGRRLPAVPPRRNHHQPDQPGQSRNHRSQQRPGLPVRHRHRRQCPHRHGPGAVRHHARRQHGRPADHQPAAAVHRRDVVNAAPEQSPPEHDRSPAPARSREGSSSFDTTSLHHGRLPRWFPGAVLAGVAAAVGGLLGVTGFSIPAFVIGTASISWLIVHVSAHVVEGRRKAVDRTITMLVTAAFLAALVPLVSVLYTVVSEGIARFDVELFTFSQAGIISSGAGGVYHAIIGTLVTTGLATLISVPIGVLTAIYLVEYGRGRLKTALTVFVDIMVGIPSI